MKYSLQQPVLFDFFCYRMTGSLLSGSSCLLIPCLLGLPAANQPCSRLYLAYSSECQYRVFHGTFSAVHQSSCPQCCSCGVCTTCCMRGASCHTALVSCISSWLLHAIMWFFVGAAKCGHFGGRFPTPDTLHLPHAGTPAMCNGPVAFLAPSLLLMHAEESMLCLLQGLGLLLSSECIGPAAHACPHCLTQGSG